MYNIYSLNDPTTNEVRYVGVTKNSIDERLAGHIKEVNAGSRTYKSNWIRSITSIGLKPTVNLIEQVSDEEWIIREKFWIAFYKENGVMLTNLTEGGDGRKSFITPQEVKDKISLSLTGRPGRPHSEETKKKLSDMRKGKPLSQKHKESLIKSPESRKKMSDAQKGKKLSVETKEKIRATLKNKVVSEEQLAQLNEARKVLKEKRESK